MSESDEQVPNVYGMLPIMNKIPGRVSALDMAGNVFRPINNGAIYLLTSIYELIRDNGNKGYLVYSFKIPATRMRLPFIVRTLEQDGYSVIVDFSEEELIINWYIPVKY